MKAILNEKETFWYDHLTKQENSKLSVMAYATQNNLSDKTLYHWKRRLKNKGLITTKPKKSVFSKVKRQSLPQQASISTFAISLPNGIRIDIANTSPIPTHVIRELMSL